MTQTRGSWHLRPDFGSRFYVLYLPNLVADLLEILSDSPCPNFALSEPQWGDRAICLPRGGRRDLRLSKLARNPNTHRTSAIRSLSLSKTLTLLILHVDNRGGIPKGENLAFGRKQTRRIYKHG